MAIVEEMDLAEFAAGYRADGRGGAAYHPAVLVALVLYCYAKGIRSSRKIEAACLDDVGCRIITANHQVDHATVARFLRRHRSPLEGLFIQVLALCADRGLVDLAAVAIDGSPMDANASKDSNLSLQRLADVAARTEAEIHDLLWETFVRAHQSECDGFVDDDLPPADAAPARSGRLCDRVTRARSANVRLHERALPSDGEIKVKVDAAERMVARARQRLAAETAAQQARLDDYARRTCADQAAGLRGAKGRPPVGLEAKTEVVRQRERLARAQAHLERARDPRPTPAASARASLTDPDSRLVPGKRGGYLQGYNLQIACARNQVLLAIGLQDNPADMTALVPMVRQAQSNCTAAGITNEVRAWLADSGYASAANFTALAGIPLFVSVTNEGQQTGRAEPPDIDAIPAGQREMAALLATPDLPTTRRPGRTRLRPTVPTLRAPPQQPRHRRSRRRGQAPRHRPQPDQTHPTRHRKTPLTAGRREPCDSLPRCPRRRRNPARTRHGVGSFPGAVFFCQRRGSSATRGAAARSCA